ncbi:MAG: primosomal protein N', partial [Nitratireductor sp.]
RVWRGVAEGRVKAVIGARSALFLPFPDLGLIVIDEEHESAFKQEEGVTYHARDMGVVRGSLGSFPVILSSATPSLESAVNAEQGRYERLVLTGRHGDAQLPRIGAVDMRTHPPERGRWLSPVLVKEMVATLEAGEQSMLFLNRRGYAPLTLCRTCGHRIQCPDCSAWLVEHRFRRELRCHHCGYTAPVPKACPSCGAEDALVACGPGVERIAEEVAERFPEARVALVSSDNLRGPQSHVDVFSAIENREVDIVIGTQVMAKGHHFPWLTLVGVVDADLGLENGDLRAGERTFQLLQQVAGRAGRAERPGRVLLQSYMPEHGVMRALVSGDRDAFLEREAEMRERMELPPYGRLVGVVGSSTDGGLAQRVAREMARRVPAADHVSVLGPAPAPIALLRGRTRLRFLVKAGRNVNVQAYMNAWLADFKVPNAARVSIDIDPYSFL